MTRCQKCGASTEIVPEMIPDYREDRTGEYDREYFYASCVSCEEHHGGATPGKAEEAWDKEQHSVRASKRFELVVAIAGRPTESVVALLGPCKTKQPILEVISEADAILAELYGEMP